MPNWCNNTLRISGPDTDIQAFKARAVGFSAWSNPQEGEKPNLLNFHSLIPIPEEVLQSGYESAGYDWERANWGGKWGACGTELIDEWETCLVYQFDTAWSPPLPFIQHIAKQWPPLTFVLEYEEGGMGFKGLAKAHQDSIQDLCISL